MILEIQIVSLNVNIMNVDRIYQGYANPKVLWIELTENYYTTPLTKKYKACYYSKNCLFVIEIRVFTKIYWTFFIFSAPRIERFWSECSV